MLFRIYRQIPVLFAVAAALLLGGCVTLDRNTPRDASIALTETEAGETTLGRKWSAAASEDPQQSAFRLLPDNLEAFAARVAMIDLAERTLDLQYYIFTDDETGLFIVDRLVAAADRGVRVRILVDDMSAHGKEAGIAAFDAHPLIEMRVFNPWKQRTRPVARIAEFLATPRLNHRMHNKTMIADGVLAVFGGRNLADEYFDLSAEFNFRDLDVAVAGPAVAEANRLFDAFWNGPNAVPITGLKPAPDAAALFGEGRIRLTAHRERMKGSAYAQAVLNTEFVEQLKSQSAHWIFARGRVLGDAPDKPTRRHEPFGTQAFGKQMWDAFYSAKRELLVSTPYFVPRSHGTGRLCELAKGGVDVRILTNSLASNDLAVVHANYAKYRVRLLKGGVDLYELRRRGASVEDGRDHHRPFGSANASLHAKTFVVDRERVFIGSLNLDPRSVVYNTEVGVLIESPELAESVAQSITRLLSPAWSYKLALTSEGWINWVCTDAGGKEIRLRHDPDTSWWGRRANALLGLLPIEGQV